MGTSQAPQPVFGRSRTPDDAFLAKAAPEPALEPELPIIDTHHHFWHRGEHRYFVEELARDIEASGANVVATVIADCNAMYRADGPEHLRSVGETEFFVGMAAIGASGQYTRTRVGASIIAHADLTAGDRTRELLEAHVAASGGRVTAVRHTAKWDADPVVRGNVGPGRAGLYLEPAFGKGLALAASMNLAFDASIYHPQIGEVTALAQAHPEATIVVIHSGSPVGYASYAGREAEVHASWLAGMKTLARCPNTFVKLGGLLMNLGNYDFTQAPAPITAARLAQLWRPYIEPCIELFGARRCMVASNFPVDKAGFGYGTVWNMFKRITAGCSADEKREIYSGTARRVYCTERPAHVKRETP